MREFTDIEIDLCKKIAEKKRKRIEYGSWFIDKRDVPVLAVSFDYDYKNSHYIYLWQEHDCLEWLRKKKWCVDIYFKWLYPGDYESDEGIYIARIWRGETWKTQYMEFEGETQLEALLHAVLAVMESKP